LGFLENKFIDWRFRARGELDAPVKIVYVDIDTKSLADLGNMPWDRGYYVEVCEALLKSGGAKAIGVDLVFSEKGQPDLADRERFATGNRKLAKFLFSEPPVVLAATYAAAEDRDINHRSIERALPSASADLASVQPPELPEFRVGATLWTPPLVGLIDTIDAGTREVPLIARTSGRTYYHMAVELVRLYWDLPREAVYEREPWLILKQRQGAEPSPEALIPLLDHRDVEVNWFSRWDSPRNTHVSFSSALAYARMLASTQLDEMKAAQDFFSRFEKSIVLIGPVDPLLQDLAPTPFDLVPVPRVGVHGNLLKTIITGRHLSHLPHRSDDGITVVLALLICALATAGGARSARFKVFAGLLLVSFVVSAFFLFSHYHLILPLTAPIGAAFTTSFGAIAWQLIYEEKQKSRIKGMFGAYVSPELVNRMVESGDDPKLGGAEMEITSFFSDIQDFSAFAELLRPQQLVELMNEYLTACTDTITEQGGTLDKYVGDAVVAMFGAPLALPDHAYRACIASQLIQLRLAELRGKWSEEGAKWPSPVTQMHTRIGMNSGLAVVGNMGSLTRFNYTMMGDNVNLAARLEGAAKNYGVGTLVTEMTKNAAEKYGDRCVFRFLDKLVVKGRSRPVSIFELAGLKDRLSGSALDCIEIFNAGIEYYLRQDWTSAADCFARSATLEPARPSMAAGLDASTVFLKRCAAMNLNPPGKDWDGVFVLKTK
jgi:adenylate cyclase